MPMLELPTLPVPQLRRFLAQIHERVLTPQEFVTKYGVTQQQLADILGVSLSLVKSWFAKEAPRPPEQRYLDRLAEIDALLTIQALIPNHIRQILPNDK